MRKVTATGSSSARQRTRIGRSLIVTVLLLAFATPAAAADLERMETQSAFTSASPKTQVARCPLSHPRVVGGGGFVITADAAGEEAEDRVMLTALQPFRSASRDGYLSVGYETAPGIDGNWRLDAYALCASGLGAVEIVSKTTDPSSAAFKTEAARCPGTMRVLGTGARVSDAGGQVGLQLTRASKPRDISRAAAREYGNGYGDQWALVSYAVCAFPIGGPPTAQLFNPPVQLAYTGCPDGTSLLGPGGGGGLRDNGRFAFLQQVYPYLDVRRVQVFMTVAPPDGMVAQAVCAPL